MMTDVRISVGISVLFGCNHTVMFTLVSKEINLFLSERLASLTNNILHISNEIGSH